MPDIKLKTWSAEDKTHESVPYVWLDAPESTEENPVRLPFTYGSAVSMQVESLDFSEGDMEIGVPEGNLVSALTIKQPEELVPEVIAKGYRVCGIDGKHEGGTGFVRKPVMAEGSYTATVTGGMTVTHGLGILPDMIIVSGTNTTEPSIIQAIGCCTDMLGDNIEGKQFALVYYISATQVIGNVGIESRESSDAGLINNAGPKTFDIGGNLWRHIVGETYCWKAIGGIVERSGFFYIKLSLDGSGNLLVYDGVPAITQLEVYVDGIYAKTVDYSYGEVAQIDISDVANDFRTYTITVKALGEDLEERYPYQEYDSVTGWVMVNVDDAVAYGDCGENAKWKLTTDGVLYVSGIGAMDDYSASADQPWADYGAEIVSVVVTEGITQTGTRAFQYLNSLTSITLPDSLQIIGANLAYGCKALAELIIPPNVTKIGGSALYGCTALTSLVIPDSVTSIGTYLCRGCTALENVVIGNGLVKVNSYAFYLCENLKSVTIGNAIKTIELYAFHTCTALSSVTMGNNVETINYRAFQGCAALTSIVIPATVTLMGDNVFYGCNALTSATFKTTTGWKVYTSSTATSGTSISSSYLASASTAALYLRSTYVGRWWKRT